MIFLGNKIYLNQEKIKKRTKFSIKKFIELTKNFQYNF